jgi:hypothetical protein
MKPLFYKLQYNRIQVKSISSNLREPSMSLAILLVDLCYIVGLLFLLSKCMGLFT